MLKFKQGQKVRIISNKSNHKYPINSIVTIGDAIPNFDPRLSYYMGLDIVGGGVWSFTDSECEDIIHNNLSLSKDVLNGLYLIMCGIPNNFDNTNYEVIDEAKSYMIKAHEFIINYGKENGFDIRGNNLK